ncbi:TonB-dependent receptor plug domain-containing protein [Oleiharenicola lentus]|uniref:TonB-dependent receptor plug domain-containing protein n=1 Tax=Oleiharenicola lentus TaxID=2508720 RepID=UPI003F681C52
MKSVFSLKGNKSLRAFLSGALTLAAASIALAQQVAQSTTPAPAEAEQKAVPVDTKPAVATTEDSAIELSPFQVTSTRDQGYRATSTMSGTRLKTDLADLAAPISVVTKQQLEDTASTDINDIFKYELSTEGTSQWTDFTVDRGNVTDNISREPTAANRMRGLTSANVAVGGFTVNLPQDTYNVDSVEISRGPNSTVFGLGSTGGGVNFIRARANTTRDSNAFATRVDSYDGYRGSFDLNRMIIRDKLAFRLLGLYEDKGYVRKPSEDITRRLNPVVTFRPFKNTTIFASFESYRNQNNRPNSLTPRDTVTDWINSGKPTWNPITQTVRLANGTTIGPVTQAQEAALLPYGLALTDTGFQNSPSAYINPDGTVGLLMISRLPNATSTGPSNVGGTGRLLQNGSYYIRNQNLFPLYNSKQITDQSLYDWTELNLVAPNFASRKGETSTVQIEQVILNTGRQSLAMEGAWLKEKIANFDRRFFGTGGANLQPYIDVNEVLLDGTPNPYFLRPYIGGAPPRTTYGRNNSESFRSTLAYDLDLSREKNILSWLGRNRFTGYNEYRAFEGGSLGFQEAASSTNAWMGTVASRNNTPYRIYPRYYIGDAAGQNVDYAPAAGPTPAYTLPLRYFNGVTNQWINDPTTYDYYYNSGRYNKRILSTYGGVWQGFFWDGRIVPLYGVRQDYNRTRESNAAINPTAATNGYYDYSPVYQYGTADWVKNKGRTDTYGLVIKPLKNKEWLALSYNQSNSFNPGSTTYDVWGLPLADPRGESKDYGVTVNLFDGKLSLSLKQFETVDIGRSTSDLNTIVQRTIRMDRGSGAGDPGLTDWYITRLQLLNPALDQATAVQQTLAATGADYDYIRSHLNQGHGDASNSYSRGKELEITYNPTLHWRIKLTASQSNPLNGIMSPAVQEYINERMPVWTTIKDPVTGLPWWTTPKDNGVIARDWYTQNVLASLKLAVALQGKRRSQTAEYQASLLTNYDLVGLTSNRWLKPLTVGGSLRWRDESSIGFLAAAPDADGIVREYDPNKPVWEKGETTVDLSAVYRLRLFNDKVRCKLQLNVNNVFEDGTLKPVAVNPDGTPWAFRIVDPRQFILSASFEL